MFFNRFGLVLPTTHLDVEALWLLGCGCLRWEDCWKLLLWFCGRCPESCWGSDGWGCLEKCPVPAWSQSGLKTGVFQSTYSGGIKQAWQIYIYILYIWVFFQGILSKNCACVWVGNIMTPCKNTLMCNKHNKLEMFIPWWWTEMHRIWDITNCSTSSRWIFRNVSSFFRHFVSCELCQISSDPW